MINNTKEKINIKFKVIFLNITKYNKCANYKYFDYILSYNFKIIINI